MPLSDSQRLRLAFVDTADARWPGGMHYLKNLFVALRSLDEGERPEIALVTGAGSAHALGSFVDRLIPAPPEATSGSFWRRQAARLRRRLGLDSAWALQAVLRKHGADCLFSMVEYGGRFDVPLVSWIPDFQHLRAPEWFSAEEIRFRNALYSRLASYAGRVVLSSQDARRDFEQFAPDSRLKARVLSFVSHVPDGTYDSDPEWVCEQYDLPRRFFYLPNQFWTHKNHLVVLDALDLLKSRHEDITVVCTGSVHEYRAPMYFAELLAQVSRLKLRDRLIILGVVPHAHIFQLMRQSLALLQPSLFEGWSTTVEEAKSVGKRIVLSDIPVHREQNPPGAVFFDPRDPQSLARCLVEVASDAAPGPNRELEQRARVLYPSRLNEFGGTFVRIAREVVAPSGSSVRPSSR
jgi:glycosyltransferase involved in cell wall biosynthesis